MTLVWIVLAIVLISFFSFKGLAKVYKNPKIRHQITPAKYNIPFEEIRFPTQNSRQLYGWWIRDQKNSGNKPTLILVHGWGRNVERVMPYIRELYPRGYDLLAFDSRNHGSSDSDEYSTMAKFAEDIQAAIDFIESKNGADSSSYIGVIGLSIGGAASIYAAAQDGRIQGVATVGAFAHPGDIMRLEFKKRHIPYFPIVWLLFKYIEHKIGKKLDDIAPIHNIPKVRAPIFLIHGEEDRVVPLLHGRKLASAGSPEKIQFWVVPGKGHSNCHTHPEFWERMEQFFKSSF